VKGNMGSVKRQASNVVGESASDFFVAGGTLRSDAPSYVERPADDELFNLALAGTFCYVLTPRQMGKSSLMIRTARRLKTHGVHTAIVDLTSIGTNVTVDQWYLSLLSQLKRRLRLAADVEAWWQARASVAHVQRFTDFLRDVVLTGIEGDVVVFIDEIDSTLNLDFRDDFFAAIRAMYNARAEDAEFERLTFVLLGVASPTDLISDHARTPFNIGQGIALEEFSQADAAALVGGLEAMYPGQSEAIFARIYYWTGGHPYLTQKLCLAVAEAGGGLWTDERVDGLVEELLLTEEARSESNLKFVQSNILNHPQRDQLLRLYRKVLKEEDAGVEDDGQSPIHNQLKLSGIVRAEDGRLRVRNQIYRRVFDLAWVRANTPTKWTNVVAGVAVFVALLALGTILYNTWVDIQLKGCYAGFHQSDVSRERLIHLARIFKLRGLFQPVDYDHQAQELFLDASREEQLALFDVTDVKEADLTIVVRGLYVTLADVDSTNSTGPLLEAMTEALYHIGQSDEANELKNEIQHWHNGREFAKQGLYPEAVEAYDSAIALSLDNPATRYERARVLTELSALERALNDLDQVVLIAGGARVPASITLPVSPTLPTTPSSTTDSVVSSTRVAVSHADIPAAPTSIRGTLNPDTGLSSAQTVATVVPTDTPTLQPATQPIPIILEFVTYRQIARAVENLIYANPSLVFALMQAPSSEYVSLREAGWVTTPEAMFCNGDLEASGDFICWTHGGELDQSVQSEIAYEGDYAGVLGNPGYLCWGGVPLGSAWMYQAFSVPSCSIPMLSFKYRVFSEDMLQSDKWDSFDVYIDDTLVLRSGNTSERQAGCEGIPWDSGWELFLYDLSPYSGQDILLSFHNVSRADSWYNTWAYVDQIEISCETLPTPLSTSTSTPTPKQSTPKSTPTTTPTFTPTPTLTPTLTQTPRVATNTSVAPSYPPPELIEASVFGGSVTFRWAWSGTLAEDEWFAVRLGKAGEEPHSVVWVKEREYTGSISEAGDYVWRVAICQGDPSDMDCRVLLAISGQQQFWAPGIGGGRP